MLGTAPFALGFANGAAGLCRNGLGSRAAPYDKSYSGGWGYNNQPDGWLTYRPADVSDARGTVAHLDLMLTGGRSPASALRTIAGEYERIFEPDDIKTGEKGVGSWGGTCTCPGSGRLYHVGDIQGSGCSSFACFGGGVSGTTCLRSTGNWSRVQVTCGSPDGTEALKQAQALLMLSSQFHVTNRHFPTAVPRPVDEGVPSQGRPFKAVVVLFLNGGADSFNMLSPHSGCTDAAGSSFDLYAQYKEIRTIMALKQSEMLQIDVPKDHPAPGAQPCSKMGMHPGLKNVHRLWGEGHATWFANTGVMVEPTTKAQFLAKEKKRPVSLFAHNHQVKQTQSVEAGKTMNTKGILGRLLEALSGHGSAGPTADAAFKPYRASSYSLDGLADMVEGEKPPNILTGNDGMSRFKGYADYQQALDAMTQNVSSSIFAETYSATLQASLRESENLGGVLERPEMTPATTFPTTDLGKQFMQAAKVVKARDALQEERQVFFLKMHGYDTHAGPLSSEDHMTIVDDAIAAFEAEMKVEGVWDSTVVVEASEFARTLRANGAGTDHGKG